MGETAATAADGFASPQNQPIPLDFRSRRRVHNRVRAIAAHGYRYAFDLVHRLSADIGVSQSTLQRLLKGDVAATGHRMRRITDLLSADLRVPVPLRVEDVFSLDGTYEQPSTCDLCDCDGCYPERAYDASHRLRPAFRRSRPSDWCRYPRKKSDLIRRK